jgi:hypothetical protein
LTSPERPDHHLGALQLHEPESIAALLAALKPQAQSSLSVPFVQLADKARELLVETKIGEAAYPEATLAPRPLFQTRHAREASFEASADPMADELAWSLWKFRTYGLPSTLSF